MKICCVVGARPNFMKMAPIISEFKQRECSPYLVHTGQHYDENMSKVFFHELNLPEPNVYLEVSSCSPAVFIARVMEKFSEVCKKEAPDLIIVVGDVNSTLAAALVAVSHKIPLAHVEAGLRSFDRTMPEELNRILTDHASDLLFVTEESGMENLKKEGIEQSKVRLVGNCMVDTLMKHKQAALKREPWKKFSQLPSNYGVLTLHRPSNVDNNKFLKSLVAKFQEKLADFPIIFPIHPRTREALRQISIKTGRPFIICEPLSYLDFLGIMAQAKLVLTDSGGIQEETTVLKVPCLTLRNNTERPVTVRSGSNKVIGIDPDVIFDGVKLIKESSVKKEYPPIPHWDGGAAVRIVDEILKWFEKRDKKDV